jgi:hypothetical protein
MLLDAALRIAAEGHRVFPCTNDGKKVPLVTWRTSASDRIEVIEEWWKEWPSALIGHPTGMRSSSRGAWCVTVIDVDVKKGATGPETLAMMEQQLGFLPETCTSITRSGGQHRWFWTATEVRNSTSKIGRLDAPGLDVRAEGGFVVVPPSEGYEWIGDSWLTPSGDVQLAELPPAWVEAMTTAKIERPERNEVARAKWIADSARGREQTGDVIVRLLREIAFAPLGSRNDTLARHAFTLGLIVREGRLDEQRAAAGLEGAISAWPDGERDDRKDIDTAMRQLRAGMKT